MKIIFPTIANIMVKITYRQQKFKKSWLIFVTILRMGPMVWWNWRIKASLRITKDIWMEKKYWNLNPWLSLMLFNSII